MKLAMVLQAVRLVLPEVFKLVNFAYKKLSGGVDPAVIRRSLEKSREAFAEKDRAKAARMLNEIHSPDSD